MPLSGARGTAILAVLAALFLYGLAELYQRRLVSGDIYPVYSSLRADPLGTKLLYESLGELGRFELRRSFEPLDRFHAGGATVLYIGQDPFTFVLKPDDESALRLARGGEIMRAHNRWDLAACAMVACGGSGQPPRLTGHAQAAWHSPAQRAAGDDAAARPRAGAA